MCRQIPRTHATTQTPSHMWFTLEEVPRDTVRIYLYRRKKKNQTDLGFNFGLMSCDLEDVFSGPQFPNL